MHWNYGKFSWEREKLKKKLNDFVDGQCLIEEGKNVFRGEVIRYVIPDIKKRLIIVYFRWFYQLCVDDTKVPKWVFQPPQKGYQVFPVPYRNFYFQRRIENEKGRENREERIKLKTEAGNIVRCFKKGDPSNFKKTNHPLLPDYEVLGSPDDPEN